MAPAAEEEAAGFEGAEYKTVPGETEFWLEVDCPGSVCAQTWIPVAKTNAEAALAAKRLLFGVIIKVPAWVWSRE